VLDGRHEGHDKGSHDQDGIRSVARRPSSDAHLDRIGSLHHHRL